MQQPKISVIVPVYNVEKYLKQCLDSIVNQTYKNLEIIIVNDGTKDNSMKIVENYLQDNRIKVINKENGGLASARNSGLEKVTGKYISFIDSDDWIELNMYEELVSQINDEDILIYRYFSYDDKKKKIVGKKKIDFYSQNKLEDKYLYVELPCCCWSKLYKKEYLEKNNFKFLEILYEDVFWNIETIFSTEKIKFIDKRYDSIMKLTKEIKGKNIEEFKKKQENSYKVIYENIEKFTTTRKNNLSIGRILYLLLEKERWQVKIDGNIFVKEIDESIRFNFKRLKKEEVEVLLKKFKELLESKETRKINGMSLLDKFYWRNKVITLNLIRKIIKKKLFK